MLCSANGNDAQIGIEQEVITEAGLVSCIQSWIDRNQKERLIITTVSSLLDINAFEPTNIS